MYCSTAWSLRFTVEFDHSQSLCTGDISSSAQVFILKDEFERDDEFLSVRVLINDAIRAHTFDVNIECTRRDLDPERVRIRKCMTTNGRDHLSTYSLVSLHVQDPNLSSYIRC